MVVARFVRGSKNPLLEIQEPGPRFDMHRPMSRRKKQVTPAPKSAPGGGDSCSSDASDYRKWLLCAAVAALVAWLLSLLTLALVT